MSKQDRLNAFFGRDPDPIGVQTYKDKVARYEAAKADGNYIAIPGWAINTDGEIIVWRNADGIWETLDSRYAVLVSDLAQTIAGHLHKE